MTTTIVPAAQIPAEKWNRFIETSPQSSIFAVYEYISIVTEDWQAIIVENEGKWLAVMPFSLKQKYFLKYCLQPIFTQYWGIFLGEQSFKNDTDKYSFLQKIVSQIVIHFPVNHWFTYNFSPQFEYALPFHWHNYQLQTRYTYQIELANVSAEQLWQSLASSAQRQIKKGIKQNWQFSSSNEIDKFIDLIEHQPKNILGVDKKYLQVLKKLATYLVQSEKGKLFWVENQTGKKLAVGLFSVFQGKMLYHIGTQIQEEKEGGAMDFLIWKAIEQAKLTEVSIFDFEGSMIENIERFFRKFGAKPITYLQVTKKNKWLKIRELF